MKNKMARRLVAAVVVPEEDRTWLENEIARRLAAVWAAAVRNCRWWTRNLVMDVPDVTAVVVGA